MAVSATELKPRGALSLFDAAVRVVMLNSGTWALTLPSGALLLGAGLQLADSVTKRHSLWWPVLAWSLAWALRAVSQGATCHYVERLVVGTEPASVGASLRAAFARAPSLVTASAMMLVTSVLVWGLSAGLGFLAFGAHAVAYAVTMQGQGRPSKLFSTSRQLLGPTRFAASWVRVCGVVQVVLALNLHLTVILGLKLATSLLGFDLTYVGRFAELSNPVWVLTLIIVTFTLFEPIRAATASLLLVDGRVRQEGLDLVASVEQLPRKKKRVPTTVATALAAAVAFASLWPEQGWATTARASTTKAKSTTAPPAPPPTPAAAPEPLATEQSNVRLRLVRLRRACGSPALDQRTLTALRALSQPAPGALRESARTARTTTKTARVPKPSSTPVKVSSSPPANSKKKTPPSVPMTTRRPFSTGPSFDRPRRPRPTQTTPNQHPTKTSRGGRPGGGAFSSGWPSCSSHRPPSRLPNAAAATK